MLIEKLKQLVALENTYLGEAPIGVDDCQWIRAGAGSSDVYFAKSTFDKPIFSIYLRGMNNEEVAKRTDELFKRIRNYTDSTSSLLVRRLPSFVGKDDKHRSVYVFTIEYQTGGY